MIDMRYKMEFADEGDLEACMVIENNDPCNCSNVFKLETLRSALDKKFVHVYRSSTGAIVAYARVEYITPASIPMVSYWWVREDKRCFGLGSQLIDDVKDYLRQFDYDFLLMTNHQVRNVRNFESRGMFHVGGVDFEHKGQYMRERIYAEYFEPVSFKDMLRFLKEKVCFLIKYRLERWFG